MPKSAIHADPSLVFAKIPFFQVSGIFLSSGKHGFGKIIFNSLFIQFVLLFSTLSTDFSTKIDGKGRLLLVYLLKKWKRDGQEIYPMGLHSFKGDVKNIPRSRTKEENSGMVRGVHKKIIEVSDTQNEFFERAILIVKESFRDEDPERLRQKAGDYVSQMGNIALARRKKARFFRTLGKILAVAAAAAGLLFVIFWL